MGLGIKLSEFEFVQITIAIILGLGITAIIRNFSEQIRRMPEVKPYPLQVVASLVMLLVILQTLWGYWSVQDVV